MFRIKFHIEMVFECYYMEQHVKVNDKLTDAGGKPC